MSSAGPRFRVLGPLEVADATVRGPKQRTLLAVLLLHPGPVAADVLLRAVWGDAPPDTATGQLHTRMWRLRRLLGDVVVTHAGGYELAVPADQLDATLFTDGARRGRQLLDTGRDAEAADALTAALALWRGPVLPEIDAATAAPALAVPLAELAERRLAAMHDLGEAGLAMGRHHELVPLLRARVAEHPVREEPRGQLMLALYRCGRQAEALQVYRDGRRLLVDELGIEPGPTLHGLHERILAADPELDHGSLTVRPDAAPVVAQLPADLTDFTGRDAAVADLAHHLGAGSGPRPGLGAGLGAARGRAGGGVPVVAVSGPAGTGKTSLAVHVAHRVAPSYPHGQLFVDLRGVEEALDPALVLARFLRALGEDPRTLPDDVDERAALFRARTAGLRLLVVLDNAAGEAQLRPLLPAGPGCAVLVTSRRRLAALGATHSVDLDVLDHAAAVGLLLRIVAPALEEPPGGGLDEVAAVVRHCGHLPLAIRIAGARLAARPHWPLARLAELLADERMRLDALNAGDLDVRSSLALSYRGLSGIERRALRLLSLLDAPDVGAWIAAPLLDIGPARADELVEGLVEARLLDVRRGADGEVRFGLHDLVRGYARERSAAEDPPEERAAALSRAFGAWLALAEDAAGRLAAGFRRIAPGDAPRWHGIDPPPDPVAWLESERAALVATVHQAATTPVGGGTGFEAAQARDLACTLARFFELREHLDDWAGTHTAALRAAQAAGDTRGEAHLLRGLGELNLDLDRYPQALEQLRRAAQLLDKIGDRNGRQHILRAIGTALRFTESAGAGAITPTHPTPPSTMITRTVDAGPTSGIHTDTSGDHGRGLTATRPTTADTTSTGDGAAQPETAAGRLADALDAAREVGDAIGEAQALHGLGVLHRMAGRDGLAEEHYREALTAFAGQGDEFGQAYVLCSLGLLLGRTGTASGIAEAERCLRRSVELCRATGYRRGEALARGHLGDLHLRSGDPAAALPELELALRVCREVREGPGEAIILRRLGELHRDHGDLHQARSLLRQAITLSDRLGMRHDHDQAAAALATLP